MMKNFTQHPCLYLIRWIISHYSVFVVLVLMLILSACNRHSNDGNKRPPAIHISPPNLLYLDAYDTSGQARDVLAEDGTVYVADGTAGLVVLNIDASNKLQRIGDWKLTGGGKAYSLAKKDNYLFMASRTEGVHVLDISTPASPEYVTTIITPSDASYVLLDGNTLYIGASADFIAYDVSDPNSPALISTLPTSSPNQHITLKDGYAYVAAYIQGIRVIDIRDTTNMSELGVTNTDFNAKAITINGDYLYAGGASESFDVYKIGKPPALKSAGQVELPDTVVAATAEAAPFDFYAWKSFEFVADGDMGVRLVDVADAEVPSVVASLDTDGESLSMTVTGRHLLVADNASGVVLVDIFETTDTDGDGILDGADVFPEDPAEWGDNDLDGIGDNADPDDDNDGILDIYDVFPLDPSEYVDADGDGVGDNTDVFPNDSTEWADFDGDGIGDNADLDDDNDGFPDAVDAYPFDRYNLDRITFDAHLNGVPKLDGDQIAWRGYTSGGAPTIYFMDLNDRVQIDIAQGISGFHGIPSLSNGQVAWRVWNNVDTYSIYLWDQMTGVVQLIRSYSDGGDNGFTDKKFGYPPSYHSVDVELNNGAMTWAEWDGNDYEIMYRDAGGTVYQITDNYEDDYEPQLNNGQIAWTGDEPGGTSFDVYFWDGKDPLMPNIINVSNSPDSPDEDAHLMNGTIAYSGYTSTATKRDIHFWDGVKTTVIPLPGNDYEPQIDNTSDMITWHNDLSGSLVIYVWDGAGVELLSMPQFTVTQSPFANYGRIAFTGRTADGPDIYIGVYKIDKDDDGVVNSKDVFPLDPTETMDTDYDGIGDNSDIDADNDGVPNDSDAFPLDASESLDSDMDGVGDNADVFPFDITETADSDADGIGDVMDMVFGVTLTPVSSYDTTGQSRGIIKRNDIVYVADGTDGLKVFQMDMAGDFVPLGTGFKLPAETGVDVSLRSVRLVGNYLYLAYRQKGLYVLDVTDPANPVQVFSYDTPDRATFLEINNGRLYLSDRFGMLIFDISQPDSPVLIGRYTPPNEIERVKIRDGIMYAALYYAGIRLIDIRDPANLKELGSVNSSFAIWTVELYGNYLFAGGESSGLIVYDITDPANPLELTTIPLPSSEEVLTTQDQPPFQMLVHGSLLFVADGSYGLQVVDVTNPASPALITGYDTPDPGITWDVYIDGYTLLLGDYLGGIRHINLGPGLDYDGDGIPNYLDPYPQS